MAKRDRKKSPTKAPKKPAKKKKQEPATPEKPKPEGESALKVNPSYDEMPDEIADPGAVFRMAYLDEKKAKLENQLALNAVEYQRRIDEAMRAKNTALQEIKNEIRRAEELIKAHKDAIEAQYGIALRAYNYDDETGVLKKHGLPEEEEPQAEE